ncbi:hypothetical protein MLD38_025111 [Melastoma candidum]|uniref:Uncharacterized protein n=1 Tax=Melastoma candidum TaxID=119954 RepID=A0ACB9NVB0_9MYRT|nr:hypothetical protein MLD38_025111 [Melastoma candidum]
MDTVTRSSPGRSQVVSLLGLALVVACLVRVGECRGYVFSNKPIRRGLTGARPSPSPATILAPSLGSAANTTAPSGGSAANPTAPSGGSAVGFTVFDVTQFGAQTDEDTDNAIFFIRAWNAACKSGKPAKLLIPSGTFISSPVVFQGPCNNTVPMEVEIRGTIQASSDLSSYVSDQWFGFELIEGLNLRGGIFDGQGNNVWAMAGCVPGEPCQHLPISLKFSKSKNVYVEGVTSLNSMGFHFAVLMVSNFTGYRLKISASGDSPNTDGIHISSSSNINITGSSIATGDDCIGIIQGATNINVHDVVCGPGHGISIGSLGKWPDETNVQTVRVTNCTLKGTTNGVRIKSFPGQRQLVASDIVFSDIIMEDVQNPVIIDQNYGYHKITKPSSVQIHDVTFKNIRGTTVSKSGVTLTCSSKYPCQNILLQNVDLEYHGLALANDTAFTSSCVNAKISVSGTSNPRPCQSTA